jgi:hypothetical protein
VIDLLDWLRPTCTIALLSTLHIGFHGYSKDESLKGSEINSGKSPSKTAPKQLEQRMTQRDPR